MHNGHNERRKSHGIQSTPPAFAVVCEGCEDVIHIDEAVNVGTDIKQYWLCEHNEKCAQWFAEDLLAELMAKGLR